MPEQNYTAEEFHQAVLSAQPRIAVFDCDGTLWAPDSGFSFMRWTLAHDGFPLSASKHAWLRERYRLYEAGVVDEATMCGEMVQVYAGIPETVLQQTAQEFFAARVEPYFFPELVALVQVLRTAGVELWAVSSTTRWVIEVGMSNPVFGIPPERILAAEVAVENGIATDRLLAVPTDEAKREALISAGVTHPDVVFGNSIHDAAMLEMARQPFAVNPNQGLQAICEQRHWRVFEPADTGWRRHTASTTHK